MDAVLNAGKQQNCHHFHSQTILIYNSFLYKTYMVLIAIDKLLAAASSSSHVRRSTIEYKQMCARGRPPSVMHRSSQHNQHWRHRHRHHHRPSESCVSIMCNYTKKYRNTSIQFVCGVCLPPYSQRLITNTDYMCIYTNKNKCERKIKLVKNRTFSTKTHAFLKFSKIASNGEKRQCTERSIRLKYNRNRWDEVIDTTSV